MQLYDILKYQALYRGKVRLNRIAQSLERSGAEAGCT